MATEGQTFEQWLHGAKVRPERLSDQQRAVLHAVFQFLQETNGDYSTSRIASHFLLHCGVGLNISQVARLVGISPRSAFRHQNLSAKQVGQQIHYHFSGRPYGKLLPRHAGSIAEFLFTHPEATRDELLDFIARTWEFRVSKVALWEFLKKYGLDRASLEEVRQAASRAQEERVQAQVLDAPASGGLVPRVPDNFFWATPSTPGPSCCGPKCSRGSTRPATALPMTTVRSSGAS
jgi:transposase